MEQGAATTGPARRRPGRPLGFDREAALHAAMLLFWRHGYQATSVAELTAAMGITPPSLYAAFGDKKQLFLEAVHRYVGGPVTSETIIDGASTARAAAEGLLQASAVAFTGDATPAGCLLASAAISCSAAATDVQTVLAGLRLRVEEHLRAKINEDPSLNALEPRPDAASLAAHIMAVIQGMSTLARDGATRAKLLLVARMAMAGWPAQD